MRHQLRGVERLNQIVADRGQEAALGVVGSLGLHLGLLEFSGAVGDALLQRFVDLLELGLGTAKRRDVGECGDKAAAGHRVSSNLDDAPVRPRPLDRMPARLWANRFSIIASRSPAPISPCSALYRSRSATGRPTWISAAG